MNSNHWNDTLKLLNDHGLTEDDFNRKILYKHFEKIANGTIDGLYKNQLEKNLAEGQRLFTQSLSEEKKTIIDALIPQLLESFTKAKTKVGRILLLKSIISQWTPLSLIGSMEKGIEEIQLPENRLLLSRFNEMIDNEISVLMLHTYTSAWVKNTVIILLTNFKTPPAYNGKISFL